MELSRRGMIGGFAAVGAVGVAGFAGAASVTDSGAGTDGDENGGEDGGGNEGERAVAVDPDAPFEARLDEAGGDDGDGRRLFGASDLAHVQGPVAEEAEHLVYVALSDEGIDAFQTRLNDAGAPRRPNSVCRVDDASRDGGSDGSTWTEQTVDALIDEEWTGIVTLPFEEEAVAEDLFESLAAE